MAKRQMSEAARKAISEAAKRRWAKHRAAAGAGMPVSMGRGKGKKTKYKTKAKAGAGAARVSMGGDLTSMSMSDLVVMRRRIDMELADRCVREHASA